MWRATESGAWDAAGADDAAVLDRRADRVHGRPVFRVVRDDPYHFMTVATLAGPGNASNPQVGLPYRSLAEFDVGVRYLQKMGVRYFVVHSDQARSRRRTQPRLSRSRPRLTRTVRSAGLDRVRSTRHPAGQGAHGRARVAPDVSAKDGRTTSACRGGMRRRAPLPTRRDLSLLDRPFVADGPSSWKRAQPGLTRLEGLKPTLPVIQEVPKRTLPPVTVTDVRTTDHSVSFRVSRTGVPVMVKTSYFPNWTAHGADRPWRATPNFMVVVPRAKTSASSTRRRPPRTSVAPAPSPA